MRVVTEMEGYELEGKQPLDEEPRQIDALDAEEAAREDDDEEGEKHARNRAQTLIEPLQKQLVGTDENALQGTVNHEVPRRAVPQSADEEAEPKVEVFPRLSLYPTAAQGEVEVVFDEHTESLVPTPPKL